jgi:hypothetical protein
MSFYLVSGKEDHDLYDHDLYDDLSDLESLYSDDDDTLKKGESMKDFWKWVENDFEPRNRRFEKMMKAKKVSRERAKLIFRAISEKKNSVALTPNEQVYQMRGEMLKHLDCRDGMNLCGAFHKGGSFAVTEDEDYHCEGHMKEKCFSKSSEHTDDIRIVRRMCHMFPHDDAFDIFMTLDENFTFDQVVIHFPIVNNLSDEEINEAAEKVYSLHNNQDWNLADDGRDNQNNIMRIENIPGERLESLTLRNIDNPNPINKEPMIFRYHFEMCALRVNRSYRGYQFDTTKFEMDFRLHENRVSLLAPVTDFKDSDEIFFNYIRDLRNARNEEEQEEAFGYEEETEATDEFITSLLKRSFRYLRDNHEKMIWKEWSDDIVNESWNNNLDYWSYDWGNYPIVQPAGLDPNKKEDNRNIKRPFGDEILEETLQNFNFFRNGPAIVPHHFTMSCEILFNNNLLFDTKKIRRKIGDKYDELRKDWKARVGADDGDTNFFDLAPVTPVPS